MSTTRLPFTNDQVLRRRAEICEQNAAQPRCAGCGNDLVDRDGKCAISAEEEEQYLFVAISFAFGAGIISFTSGMRRVAGNGGTHDSPIFAVRRLASDRWELVGPDEDPRDLTWDGREYHHLHAAA